MLGALCVTVLGRSISARAADDDAVPPVTSAAPTSERGLDAENAAGAGEKKQTGVEEQAAPSAAVKAPDASGQHAPPGDAEEKKDDGARKKNGKKGKKHAAADGGAVASADLRGLGRIDVGGRVFARAALAHQPRLIVDETGAPVEEDVNSLDLSVPSARLHAKYRAPVKWLSAEVEADFAGKVELKDAFLRAKPNYFSAQAGQFKLPFSAIRLASPWDLPVTDRGFVDDVLVDRFQIAGRRPGVAFAVRGKGGVRPELVVGSFQGSVVEDVTDGDYQPIDELTLDSQSLVARATLRAGDVEFGLGYEHRVGSPEELEVEHYATGNVDAVVDTRIGGGGLRTWAEAIVGESPYENDLKPADDRDAIFVCLRLIAGYRFGGVNYADPYLEPYGMVSGLDPDTDVTTDLVLEGALGVNVGLWDLVRVGLQGELVRVGRNFPRSIYLGQMLERTALVLQAGVNF
jgi:hypothetical protein